MDFGVLSTAGIAQGSFLPGIEPTDHDVTAIASRDAADAEAVADEHGIETVYEGYDDLLENAGVDAVYIPLPNALHAEWTKKAADAGIHVLCEKPLTVDAAEARDVVDYCDDRDVTLMEAFMYQYHPRTERALELADEELEDIRSVTASFKFGLFGDPDNIRLSPDLAGGSLMDVGCYPLSFARQVLGEPDSAYAYTTDTKDSGVDTELAAILEYDEASARIACGFDTTHIQRYRIEAKTAGSRPTMASIPGAGRWNSSTKSTAATPSRRLIRSISTASRSNTSLTASRLGASRERTARRPSRTWRPSTRFTRVRRRIAPLKSRTDGRKAALAVEPCRKY